ncbi:hypothetical protein BGZ95_011394, partial [Linnemannia exigua]
SRYKAKVKAATSWQSQFWNIDASCIPNYPHSPVYLVLFVIRGVGLNNNRIK